MTHNNEQSLERTLTSVGFCDEIVVIDDRSLDKTVTIAKRLGSTVITRTVDDDFAAQRNFGLEKAKGPWVLFVDSDEVVPTALAKEIKEAILRVDVQGFYLKRQDVLWGRRLRYGETGQVRLLRLGKKGKGTWVRPVHETWNITGVVATLPTPLEHVPHPNITEFLADINRYSTINAMHFYRKHEPIAWWHIPLYPAAKFLQNYVFRRGFLDGMPGAVVSLMMSFHSFLTRAKLWQLYHPKKEIPTFL